MAIDRAEAAKQIGRLAQIPAPAPQSKEALADLVETLADCARSEHHAKRTITAIVENPGERPRWPSMADIKRVAWDCLTDEEKTVKCDRCGGVGFTSKQIGIYDVAVECPACRPAAPAEKPANSNKGMSKAAPLFAEEGGKR